MVKAMWDMFGFQKKVKSANVSETLDIREARFVVVDTELTGLNEKKDSIVSIGALRMSGGRIQLEDAFYRLINPETEFSPASVVIHGITPSDVREKPDIGAVLSEFLDFCGDDILVGHCVSIDMSFMNREMKRILGSTLRNAALDTFSLYEWLRKKMPSHRVFSEPVRERSLYGIAERFDISSCGAHNAIMDAFITAQVFQRFIPMLMNVGIRSIGDLLRVGSPSGGGDKFRAAGEAVNF
ncbi:MAG TPA: 3'-5' exonuclease [Dissulfurispiraceae bacterium]